MDELQQLMAKAKKYVEQQKELFGNTRYVDREGATKRMAISDGPAAKSDQPAAKRERSTAKQDRPSAKEQPAKDQPAKEQSAKEQPAKEQSAKEQSAKERPAKEPVSDGPVPSEETALPGEPVGWKSAPTLEVMEQIIQDCRKCRLWETRTKLVFGTGNPNADIMVIGEAPGADEDATGRPFVGRAGQLLTKILAAIELEREEVYIANIIKSRPPGNRRPQADEVEACEPYLFRQMEFIKPKFILALGLTSVNTLLRSDYRMADIRGKQLEYRGATLIATYHPAALLRNPQWKAATWEDVKLLRRLYDDYKAGKGA